MASHSSSNDALLRRPKDFEKFLNAVVDFLAYKGPGKPVLLSHLGSGVSVQGEWAALKNTGIVGKSTSMKHVLQGFPHICNVSFNKRGKIVVVLSESSLLSVSCSSPSTLVCPACNTPAQRSTANFCDGCGQRLSVEEAAGDTPPDEIKVDAARTLLAAKAAPWKRSPPPAPPPAIACVQDSAAHTAMARPVNIVPPGSRAPFCLEVDEDAQVIGSTIEAAGGKRIEGRDKDFLDLAFETIRSKSWGEGIEVKEELGHDGEQIDKCEPLWHQERVPVSKLHYTQSSIKREFTDGRQFDALLADLLSGDVNLDTDERMVLEVIRKNNGKYYSTGNRRLKVFKMYQEECEHEVCVTCRVFPWHPAYDRFMERYGKRERSGLTDGDCIRVRKAPRFR